MNKESRGTAHDRKSSVKGNWSHDSRKDPQTACHPKSHFHSPGYSTLEKHSYFSPVQLVPISLASGSLRITPVFSHHSCQQEPSDLQQDCQSVVKTNLVKGDCANVTIVSKDSSGTLCPLRLQEATRIKNFPNVTMANQDNKNLRKTASRTLSNTIWKLSLHFYWIYYQVGPSSSPLQSPPPPQSTELNATDSTVQVGPSSSPLQSPPPPYGAHSQ